MNDSDENSAQDPAQNSDDDSVYAWVLGPSEELAPLIPPYPAYYCYPPYCTPPQITAWRIVATPPVEQVIYIEDVETEVAVVSQWVEQVVRKELGPALVRVQKQTHERLSIEVSPEAAALIHQALKSRSQLGYT